MPPLAYDLRLFEELNDRYQRNPLVPKPHSGKPAEYADRAKRVLERVERHVTLRGRDVLEVGCGEGWLTECIASVAGARQATGVDLREGEHWKRHTQANASYLVGDLTREEPLPKESVDVIVSSVVFEHVQRPIEMFAALYKLLRPGGVAWLNFNLYRGPKASHVYRHVHFPWPHLLFEDQVCRQFYEKHYGIARTYSWVNKLTAASYVNIVHSVGFDAKAVDIAVTPIDTYIYGRFMDKLGRYPAFDLESDFMTMVLRKTGSQSSVWPLDYAGRQVALISKMDT